MEHHIGSAIELAEKFTALHPELGETLDRVRARVPHLKREIWAYQAMALYHLVKPYNRDGATILEIGTAFGFSAAVMASAAPLAKIITLNPKEGEVDLARKHLASWANVTVVQNYSVPFLEAVMKTVSLDGSPTLTFDVIFVDGDHKRIRLDMPYYNLVRDAGLFLHHDYSPEWSPRPCTPVYEELNHFSEHILRRDMDVIIVDDTDVGMAGWYKQPDDPVIDLAKL